MLLNTLGLRNYLKEDPAGHPLKNIGYHFRPLLIFAGQSLEEETLSATSAHMLHEEDGIIQCFIVIA